MITPLSFYTTLLESTMIWSSRTPSIKYKVMVIITITIISKFFYFKIFPCPKFSLGVGGWGRLARPETHKMNEIVTSLTLVGNLSKLPPTIQVNENLSAPSFCQQAFILSISLMIFFNFRHGYQINRINFLSKGLFACSLNIRFYNDIIL